jgi:hypothetical protein
MVAIYVVTTGEQSRRSVLNIRRDQGTNLDGYVHSNAFGLGWLAK